MITIQITQSGHTRRETVEQAEFVVRCEYGRCRKEFTTIDADKWYCSYNHRMYAYRYREAGITPTYTRRQPAKA